MRKAYDSRKIEFLRRMWGKDGPGERMKEYTIFINGTLVGHIEADSQEEAVEYARENWKIEAITDEEYDKKYEW